MGGCGDQYVVFIAMHNGKLYTFNAATHAIILKVAVR